LRTRSKYTGIGIDLALPIIYFTLLLVSAVFIKELSKNIQLLYHIFNIWNIWFGQIAVAGLL
jgi:hypothetical protein